MTYMENGLEYIAGRTALEALDAAEDPQYQQAVDPYTGKLAFNADGSRMLFPVPLAQRAAPGVKKRLEWMLWLRVASYVFIGGPFFAVVLIRVAGPDWLGDWLYETFLPILFTGIVWGGAVLGAGFFLYLLGKMIKHAFTPPSRKRL